ncbi:MAG: SGNH hydrolase domain-containing protein, partial [Pseudoclavibacter sp.]
LGGLRSYVTRSQRVGELHLVLVLATRAGGPGEREQLLEQTLEWAARQYAVSPKTEFVFVRDNPRLGESPFECATASSYENIECREEPDIDDVIDFRDRVVGHGFVWVDLNETICPHGVCSPSQGGVVVYRDANHLTATYSKTLAQVFADQVAPLVEWWPNRPYEGVKVVDERYAGDVGGQTGA